MSKEVSVNTSKGRAIIGILQETFDNHETIQDSVNQLGAVLVALELHGVENVHGIIESLRSTVERVAAVISAACSDATDDDEEDQ